MLKFQNLIDQTIKVKSLNYETIADASNLSVDSIELILSGDQTKIVNVSSSIFKNQVRRVCEYLEIKEKNIVSILNQIDIIYYKHSKLGKLKTFDCINRFIILAIAVYIIFLGYKIVEYNISDSKSSNIKNDKSIIYVPINYNKPKTITHSSKELPPIKNKNLKKAHPPAKANVKNIVIDDNQNDVTNNKLETDGDSLKSENENPKVKLNTKKDKDSSYYINNYHNEDYKDVPILKKVYKKKYN